MTKYEVRIEEWGRKRLLQIYVDGELIAAKKVAVSEAEQFERKAG